MSNTSFNITTEAIKIIEKSLPNLKVDFRISMSEQGMCLDVRFKNIGNNLNNQVVNGLSKLIIDEIITIGYEKKIEIGWNYNFNGPCLEMVFEEKDEILVEY